MPSTAHIKALVWEALESVPRPFTEDVIDEVFFVIESTPELRRRYDALVTSRGKSVVNAWGGQWIADAVERQGRVEVKAKKSSLIGQYSKLDRPAPPKPRWRREMHIEAAGREVFNYYATRKGSFPAGLAAMRDEITAMVANGVPVADAFSTAVQLLSRASRD